MQHLQPNKLLDKDTAAAELLKCCSDMAWWFGWSVETVYGLELDDFEDWLEEVNRQIKAGYNKAM